MIWKELRVVLSPLFVLAAVGCDQLRETAPSEQTTATRPNSW